MFLCIFKNGISKTFTYKYIYKLVNLVEGDPKAAYSIATTLRCRLGQFFSMECCTLPLIYT